MAKYRNGLSWALNSAVECHLHTVEVIGSNPIAPTINQLAGLNLTLCACPEMSSWAMIVPYDASTIRTTFE